MGEAAVENIIRLINSEIRQKRAPEEAFSRLCQVLKAGRVSTATAKEWIQRYNIGDRTLEDDQAINPMHLALLKLLATQYLDRKYLMYEQPFPIYSLVYLSDRYFIVYDNPDWKLGSLYVYDLYHGQTQQLCINNVPHTRFLSNSYFQMHSTDSDHLLVAEHGSVKPTDAQESVYSTYLYLIRVKYNKWNGQASHWDGEVLDSTCLEHFYLEEKILFQPEDRNKFTLFESDEFFDAVKGQIVNGKIELSEKVSFGNRLRCKRLLEENRVQGIRNVLKGPTDTYENMCMSQLLDGVHGFNFSEHSLNLDTTNNVQDKVACKFTPPACANWFHVPVFKWSKQRLYIDLIFLQSSFSVYSFDPQTGQAQPTGLAGLGRERGQGSIIDMHVDDNEVLTVAIMGNSNTPGRWPLCIYRYPTKSPDTLQNIVWQSIRRLTKNFPGYRYVKVIQLLGNNSPLIPFSKKLC